MRRTLLSVVGFSIAVVVLVGLKSGPVARLLGWSAESGFGSEGMPLAGGDAGIPGAGSSSAAPGAWPGTAPGPASGSSATGGTSGATTGPAATATNPAGPSTSNAPPPPPPPPRTVAGVAVAVRTAQSPTSKSGPCGDCANYSIAVTITVTDGRITATSVAYSPSPGESQSYASSANNRLKSAILSAQTWNLGRVSGATYSGNAWELSVKDAMSKVGLPV